MNIKVKAAGITAGLIIAALAAVELLKLVTANLTREQVAGVFAWISICAIAFCMYKLVLLHLETRNIKD